MATKKTVESPEFLYLSLGDIVIEEQIRSSIDTESESFKVGQRGQPLTQDRKDNG